MKNNTSNIKTMKIIYLIIFLTLAFWSLFAYNTINNLIEEQKVYANLINITGKQRMLSQKTTLFAKRVLEQNDTKIYEHFLELISLMKKDHNYILKHLTSKTISNIYYKEPYFLDKSVKEYFLLLEKFDKEKNYENIQKVQDYSFLLLPKLNFAVYAFEKEINDKTKELEDREFYILIGALLTLIFEALFIVVPSIKTSQKSELALRSLNKELQEKVKKELKKVKAKDELLNHQSKMIMVSKLLENIAHYWRQPLSIITTSSSGILLKKEFGEVDDKELEDCLNTILDNSMYLSNTIEKYRNFFDHKKEKNDFFIDKANKNALNLLSNKLQEFNIEVKEDIQKINYNSFESDLVQVLFYIYENAKDILIEKNVKKKLIFTKIYKNDNEVIIDIKDNAGGISEKIINKIFDPFFTTKEKKVGTGIDLYVSKQLIINSFNGSLDVKNSEFVYENKSYKGANFLIRLPIV